MTNKTQSIYWSWGILLLAMLLSLGACKKKEDVNPDNTTNNGEGNNGLGAPCQDSTKFIFEEKNGLLIIESESMPLGEGWQLETSSTDFTGKGYTQWHGKSEYSTPGKGLITYKIRVNTPGTYRVQWRSRINEGTDHTEANDAWLRMANASDFFAMKDNHKLYPRGSGKTPNPEGAGKEGWFKVYMNQTNQWSWRSYTNDHNAYAVYATFLVAGDYTIEVSGRSKGYAIDRIALYKEDTVQEATATDPNQAESIRTCQ
ncbi:hypothetical protein [uncultured Microscilla sp.]|uniref:hypothetical protein n=1 Tax=uncultured Microscilla sp. TaxID=432653 RepID=UPI00261AD883|nr:hypothetical protein [uncultured Microscilla sp.]